MPISKLKRRTRRLHRRIKNLGKIVHLTLSGNGIPRNENLRNAKNPVFMIYGFGASRRTLSILENRLKNDGYTIITMNLGGMLGTFNTEAIDESARRIDKKIEQIYKKYKIKGKISMIGHSKGGLIGAYYIKFLNGAKRVKTFITLGTPHNGNPWAAAGSKLQLGLFFPSIKQMSPESPFLEKLHKKNFPKSIRVYSIYSKDDMVCPFPVSVLEDEDDNVENIEIMNVTHAELLIKKSVYYALKHGLNQEMPESWRKASQKSYHEYLIKDDPDRQLKVVK